MIPNRRAMAYAAVLAAAWAAEEALGARLAGGHSFLQVVFVRYAVILACVVAAWGLRAPASLWRTRRPALQLGRALLMAAMPACFVRALEGGVPLEGALTAFWVAPLLALVAARAALGERAAPFGWAVAGLASAAAVALYGAGAAAPPAGAVLALASAAAFALYLASARAVVGEPIQASLFYTALGVAAAFAPAMPSRWITPSPRDGALLAAIGLLGLAQLWAIHRATAAAPLPATAAVLALQVVFAVGIEVVLRHAHLGVRAAVALPFIACAALLAWVRAPALTAEGTP